MPDLYGNSFSGSGNYGGNYGGNNGYGGNGGFGGGYGGNGGFGGGYGGFGGSPQKKETHFAAAVLAASIIGSVLFFGIGELIYRFLISEINSIWFTGVYFAVFGLILALSIFIAARISKMEFSVKRLLIALLCVVLLFLLGTLFEFVYELNFKTAKPLREQYIFAMDNSGSMEENDPEQKRVDAVYRLLENKDEDTEYAVYTFGNEISCIREMSPLSDGMDDITIFPNGGTPMVEMLNRIMDDVESGKLPCGQGSQVILLTDGVPSDAGFFGFEINGVLRRFSKKGIVISTVGLGQVDRPFLEKIANETGGVCVTTDNVDELENAMQTAARIDFADRNLLSPRWQEAGWLYALLRIVFVMLLGFCFIGIKLGMTDGNTNAKMIVLFSLGGSLLGAVLLEVILLLGFAFAGSIARLLAVLFIGITITTIERLSAYQWGNGTLGRL